MKQRKKILFLIDSFDCGGAERQMVELLKCFSNESKFELHVGSLLRAKSEGYEQIVKKLDLKFQYFPRKYKYDLSPILQICKYIKTNNIQIVQTFLNLGSLFGVIAARVTFTPVVCSAIRNAKDMSFKWKYLNKFLALISDRFVFNSTAGLKSRYRHLKSNFRIVYNGVDFSRFDNDIFQIEKLKIVFGLTDFSHIIGMVSSLSKTKDHETLFKAAPAVIAKFPNICFLIIGDGHLRKHLEYIVLHLGIERNVVFTGYRSDVDRIYHILDICILLSNSKIHCEGISNALIEAMACRIPVIATNDGGTPEFIQNRTTGLLVPPLSATDAANAMIELLSNCDFAKKLADNGQKVAKKRFDLARYKQEYENLYDSFT
jgi:glycosyltransferase involved in cell wall biosynthesis